MSKATAAQEAPCEIRFGQVGLAQLRLRSTNAEAVRAELSARLAAAPQLFERTAVCVDLSTLETAPGGAELRAVLEAVRTAGFFPIALVQGAPVVDALARELDLPVLAQWRTPPKPALGALLKGISPPAPPSAAESVAQPGARAGEPALQPGARAAELQPDPRTAERSLQPGARTAEGAATAADVAPAVALLHHQPVRSGQRVYARHRDLVVTAAVGAGAEVMADGCVHVYGSLRGRALAGARGETSARVFCQEFNAELVSIAGVFRVFETIPPELAGKPVQAWLDGDDLRFARVGA